MRTGAASDARQPPSFRERLPEGQEFLGRGFKVQGSRVPIACLMGSDGSG